LNSRVVMSLRLSIKFADGYDRTVPVLHLSSFNEKNTTFIEIPLKVCVLFKIELYLFYLISKIELYLSWLIKTLIEK